MASISITSTGLGAAVRGLENLGRMERKTIFRDVGAAQILNIKKRVDERRSHEDKPYPASRRAQLDNGTTLLDRGHMLKSMRTLAYNEYGAEFGFSSAREAQKAIWNQFGTRAFTLGKGKAFPIKAGGSTTKILAWSRKKAATPARPFFGVSPRDTEIVRNVIETGMLKAIVKAGLKHG